MPALTTLDKQLDAQVSRPRGWRSAVPRKRGLVARRRDRRRARRRAAWRRRRLVSLLMSPWLVGFAVFFGYPLVMSAYLSFNHYDLLSPPRWVGLANYRYLFTVDPQVWTGGQEHALADRDASRCRCMFAFGIALVLARARRGVGVFRTIFYLPALAPPVAATLGFVYILNPATGPVNTILEQLGIQGPLWFQDPPWSKPSLTLLGIWGVGNTMVIFLAAVLDVPRHLYESAELDGAGAVAAAALGDAADDQPGDPVRRHPRRDPGAAVLHAGLRRGGHRGRAGLAGRRRDGGEPRLSAGLDALLSRAAVPARLHDFQMGYASAMAMLLLAVVVRGDARDRRSTRAGGCTTEGRRDDARPRTARAARSPPRAAPAVRRRRFLLGGREPLPC